MANAPWKNILLNLAEKSGCLDLAQLSLGGRQPSVYVLAYHRVDDPHHRPWLDPQLISTTPAQFDAQMRLVAEKYHPISIDDLLQAARGQRVLPKDAVLVTVDDGYRDFGEVIFPTCLRYGIRPVLFMPTAYVGAGTFWWDKLYQIIYHSGQTALDTPIGHLSIATPPEKHAAQRALLEALKAMPNPQAAAWVDSAHAAWVHLPAEAQHNTLTWDELRELVGAGAAVGCHTHTHPIMTKITLEQARQEVITARDNLRQNLGHALPIFAFPDGKPFAFNTQLFNMLHGEGFELLFLLIAGRTAVQPGSLPLVLPRLSVWQSQTLPQVHLRLTPLVSRPIQRASVGGGE